MSTSANKQFSIGNSHIDLMYAGQMTRIDDKSVEGVSTRTLSSDNWVDSSRGRRTVNIEFRDETGSLLNASIEGTVSSEFSDTLADYVRRVSHHACTNSLQELVQKETVQRNGFTINDQGLMLAASGETLCCGLFDIAAIDYAGDRTIVWTDDVLPAAVLRMDDANSQTLAKILPKLTSLDDQETPRLIGVVKTQGGAISNLVGAKAVLTYVSVVFGILGAIASQFAVGGAIGISLMIPVSIALAVAAVTYSIRSRGGTPTLAVFRSGIYVTQKNNRDEISWDDIQAIVLNDQRVNVGTAQHPQYATYCSLNIRTNKEFSFGKKLILNWPKEESTMTCAEYLQDRATRIAFDRNAVSANTDARHNPNPIVAPPLTIDGESLSAV